MTVTILRLVAAVFCILGVAEVIHITKRKILAPHSKAQTQLIIYLDSDTPDLQLLSIVNELNWHSALRPDSIICIYSFIKEEQLEACIKTAEKYNITLYSLEEAENKSIV